MAKRRRLKKPIRIALQKAKRFGATVLFCGFGTSNVLSPVNIYAEVNPIETTKVIAKLKNKDLMDAKTLKESIVSVYNSETDSSEQVETTTVVMSYPLVVSEPSVNNAVFEVIPEKKEEAVSQEDTSENAVSNTAENTSEEIVAETLESVLPEATETPVATFLETNEENVVVATEISTNEVNEGSGEVEETKEENKNKITNAVSLDDVQTLSTSTPETNASATETSSATNIEAKENQNAISDDSVVTATEDDKEEDSLIRLVGTSIMIQRNSEFNATNYILSTGNSSDPFPVLKVASDVDTSNLGTYNVSYSVVDSKGNSTTKSLQVTVTLSEADIAKSEQEIAEAIEKEKNAEKMEEFVNNTLGISWDLDGNDAWCFDLWAKYVKDEGLNFDYSCAPAGYAYNVFKKYETSGASKYFKKVSASEIQPGDWLFWDWGSSCPLSHVAMLVKNNGDGTGICLSQSHNTVTTLEEINLDVMGGFRRIW